MPMSCSSVPAATRRDFLARTGVGFGGVALAGLMAADAQASGPRIDPARPLADRPAPRPAKAKSVIFLFMYGGPSQVDTFDYKPDLTKLHGKPVPDSFRADKTTGPILGLCNNELLGVPYKWKQHGKSGMWASELMPKVAEHADDLCLVKSMVSESANHAPATYLMNTGAVLGGRPSMGSWVTYGLGSVNQNLPGYVLLYKVAGLGGSANWSNGFLPAAYQGTQFRHDGPPVLNLDPPAGAASTQRSTLDLMQSLNRTHAAARPGVPDLDGRIASYELAYRMQAEAAGAGDLSSETKQTRAMYGVDDANKDAAAFGRMCLLSRRMVEKGVRFVQVYSAADKFGWDGHDNSEDYHRKNAAQTDKAVGALLTDLKRRGLLDSTLVVWAGEFGRTPMLSGNKGRNHNPLAFTLWLAGGGVKAGQSIGATDAIGLRAVEKPQPVKNLHATILTAMGLVPDDLSFDHNGRPERLTGVAGSAKVIPGVLG